MALRLLIDMDIIAMRAALAADSKKGGDQGIDVACWAAKAMMTEIFKKMETDDHLGYLGTKGDRTQHRFEIYPDYKSNRKDLERPKYLDKVRTYLEKKFNVEVVTGIEADDALSIEQWKNYFESDLSPEGHCDTCIVTIDKDLKIVPGWHYHITKKEKSFQSVLDGLRCFYKQIITGDVADGIPRVCPKVIVTKWLKEIDLAENEKEMLEIVRKCYTFLLQKDILEVDREIKWRGQLLMPLKKLNELWQIPGDL